MTIEQTLAELEAVGTAQNRKVYARHGVSGPMFGVSYANLGKLQKRINTDQALAEQLWATGNHDARVLATTVADPKRSDEALLDEWAQDLDSYVISDAFSKLAARSPGADALGERWRNSDREMVARTGWLLVASEAMRSGDVPDEHWAPYLETIEGGIHDAQNRVRDAMNSALIAIGMRNEQLADRAIAAARRIGTVEVDHGETGCKTPPAEPYIRKGLEHKRQKAKKQGAKART